jgi:hypothetical protein
VRNHTFTDASAGKAFGLSATKNAKDIVLRAGEAMWFEELLDFESEGVGGLLEGDKDAVLDGEGETRRRGATHGGRIVVMTTNVKREYLDAAALPV